MKLLKIALICGAGALASVNAQANNFSWVDFGLPTLSTSVWGINDAGVMVGQACDTVSGICNNMMQSGSTVTNINLPGVVNAGALAINNAGTVVGSYSTICNDVVCDSVGYVRKADGSFTSYAHPNGDNHTEFRSINNAGDIAGAYVDVNGTRTVFAMIGGNAPVDIGSAPGGMAQGINASGQVVGSLGHNGFIYSNGTLNTFNVPGASNTRARAIDDSGDIAGFFDDATGEHGFYYNGSSFLTIDAPGYGQTVIEGMNSRGQLVGFGTDVNGVSRGFVMSVPEPESYLMFGAGLGLLGLMARRKAKQAA